MHPTSTPTNPRRRITQLLVALVVALGAIAAVGGIGASPASAQSVIGGGGSGWSVDTNGASAGSGIVGGCTPYCSGSATVSGVAGSTMTGVTCQPGRLLIDARAAVHAGYIYGQHVSYRYHLRASNGYTGTSGWSNWSVVPASTYYAGKTIWYPFGQLPFTSIPTSTGLGWSVSVQYAWYNSNGTVSYSNWMGPTGGYRWNTSSFLGYSNCYT